MMLTNYFTKLILQVSFARIREMRFIFVFTLNILDFTPFQQHFYFPFVAILTSSNLIYVFLSVSFKFRYTFSDSLLFTWLVVRINYHYTTFPYLLMLLLYDGTYH